MKKKNTDDLRKELEEAKVRELQLTHKLERLENRKRHLEQGERKKRTHQLCNIGGAVEGVFPVATVMSKLELYEWMEMLSDIPEVKNIISRLEEKHKTDMEKGTE